MASSTRVKDALPSTLPDDFGEWDESAASERTVGPQNDSPAAEPGAAAPPAAPENKEAPRSRNRFSAGKAFSNEKAFLDQLISMNAEADAARRAAPPSRASAGAIYEVVPAQKSQPPVRVEEKKTARTVAARASAPLLRVDPVRAKAPEPEKIAATPEAPAIAGFARNKGLVIAAVAGAVAVLILLLVLFSSAARAGRTSPGSRPLPAQPAVAVVPAPVDALKPSPSTPAGTAPVQAVDNPQAPADAAPAAEPEPAPVPQVQAQMMNDQLNAPARISAEMKAKAPDNAPPADSLDASGLGGAANPGSVLGEPAAPKVQVAAPKTVNVSAGVAVGLLIDKTPPVYPNIARTAHVSGTVVLEAVISKAGAIQNLHVVTGPEMLRQSALDAVRTWRFKPYKVNNQPTDIETTINVVFAPVR
jgi:periplasmic protein TonB